MPSRGVHIGNAIPQLSIEEKEIDWVHWVHDCGPYRIRSPARVQLPPKASGTLVDSLDFDKLMATPLPYDSALARRRGVNLFRQDSRVPVSLGAVISWRLGENAFMERVGLVRFQHRREGSTAIKSWCLS